MVVDVVSCISNFSNVDILETKISIVLAVHQQTKIKAFSAYINCYIVFNVIQGFIYHSCLV